MGSKVQGVVLKGDPRNPEPIHFRVRFPGGEVDITRTTDNDYWVHLCTNGTRAQDGDVAAEVAVPGRVVDMRFDSRAEHSIVVQQRQTSLLTRFRLAPMGSRRRIDAAIELAEAMDRAVADPDSNHLAVRIARRT